MNDLNADREPKVKSLLLGHVRLGYFDETKGYPRQSETLVFTSNDADRLKPLQRELGGTIERYQPQGSGAEPYRLISDADAITVLFPFPTPEGNLSQSWELWGAGGIKRRCDGFTCALIDVDDVTGDWNEEEAACLCDREDRECAPSTRLRVVLPSTGLGIWELQTGSIIGATELFDQVRFIGEVARNRMNAVPIRLVYAPRQISYFDPKKKKRSTTTKRVVRLSVAGDATAALGALGAPADRQLLEAVRLVLGPEERLGLPEGEPRDEGREEVGDAAPSSSGAEVATTPASSPGDDPVGAGGAHTDVGPQTPASVSAPAPTRSEDDDGPATQEQWKRALAVGLTKTTITKAASRLFPGEGVTSLGITKAQLAAVIKDHSTAKAGR
jgi:hypothetical protein